MAGHVAMLHRHCQPFLDVVSGLFHAALTSLQADMMMTAAAEGSGTGWQVQVCCGPSAD